MANKHERVVVEEFQLSIRELDNKLLEINRNLAKILQYTNRVIVPLSDGELPPARNEWDTRSMADSFIKLHQYALIFSSGKPDSPRLYFAIRCARGGLVANDNIFLGLAQELTVAFETCMALRTGLRTAAETDNVLKNTLQEVSEYMKEMGASFMKIKEVIYTKLAVGVPLDVPRVIFPTPWRTRTKTPISAKDLRAS